MQTKTSTPLPVRPALHLLAAAGLLLGLWSMDAAHAEQKKDLIEMPLIKKFKEEKAAAAAEASAAAVAAPAQKRAPEKAAAKPEADTAAQKHVADKAGSKTEGHAAAPKHAPGKVEAEPAATESKHGSGKVDKAEKTGATDKAAPVAEAADAGPPGKESIKQLRQALTAIGTPSKRAAEKSGEAGHAAAKPHRAKASAHQAPEHAGHGGEVHWSYEGENGPQAWGKLKPEFNLCAIGKRQSPIAIQDDAALLGPAEPVQFSYKPSTGSVVNNGHTVQVDLEGDNSIRVRNATFKLLQFHFHTPSEEMVNAKRYAMVAHLVHKNEAGQLAVVAVLLEPGEPNGLIDKVWTYMPLDTNDRVRLPEAWLDMNELLPSDQRYYQFMGSLTTPPCTEGVLWMVLKQPVRISAAQFKLFSQLFPLNARPVQPVNGRPVREAK